MLWVAIVIAFYLAWNLGANDVANSMGTSVGSKAVTLKQAIVIAGIFEFTGVVLFGHGVSARLVSGVIDLRQFADQPEIFMVAMLAVLLSSGIWLNVATLLGLPVSSSHTTVGALAGVGIIAIDWQSVQWLVLGKISLTWLVTPLVSGVISTMLYCAMRQLRDGSMQQLQEWLPWMTLGLVSIFGVLVIPTVVERLDSGLLHGAVRQSALVLGLGGVLWLGLNSWLLRQMSDRPENLFGRFQLVSACFVAFAHGSNDVGNAVAPLAAIAQVQTAPIQESGVILDPFVIPLWVLVLGGTGIVLGLAVWGRRVIATIGEGIMPLRPSGGFSAELATAITILLASRVGLPVSTSHALVGGVVGVGLVDAAEIRVDTLKSIVLTWGMTIPLAATIAALVFQGLRWIVGHA